MRSARTGAAAILTAAGILGGVPTSADAYVRYQTNGGQGFHWAQTSVAITSYPNDFVQPSMTTDQVNAAATASASTWSSAQNPCTYLNLVLSTSTAPSPIPGNDGHNTLIFRSTSWCALADDGTCASDYSQFALAVTSDTANTKTGQIYDSDIEVNALDYNWADVEPGAGLNSDMDLQNAITHEMGHMIGLDHTCYDPNGVAAEPFDAAGQPVPACPASAMVQATTMYPSAMAGDTQKRTLAPDDQAGLCGIYPVDHPPQPGDGGCGCAAVPTPVGWLELAGFGLVALWLARARRTRGLPRR